MVVFSSNISIGQIKYWQELSCSQKKDVLTNCNSSVMKSLYEGSFSPTDDEDTQILFKDITSSNDTILPLSFYLLNKICSTADGALAERVGHYCVVFMTKYPLYTLNFFSNEMALKKEEPIWKKYALSIGYELYFKNEGTSSIKYNYQEFKNLMYNTVKGNPVNEETFRTFWQLVDETIKNMD